MTLSFEPVHHHKVKSHTGYVWEPVNKRTSPAATAECDQLVRAGCAVVCGATTPPGVGQWPWKRTQAESANTGARPWDGLGVAALSLLLALNAVVIVPSLVAWRISQYVKARRPRVQPA